MPHALDSAVVRRRSLSNLLRMAHCAPTVAKTLADASGRDGEALVKLVGGLPGGVANTGNECGGVTAPLVLLGIFHGREQASDGVPVAVEKGRALVDAFRACHGSVACRDILGHARVPVRCARVVELAAARCLELDARPCADAFAGEPRAACARLHAHLAEQGFHCARSVLHEARAPESPEPGLLDAATAFVGGTACAGLTCSALVAGVMLLGLRHARMEWSARRTLRLLAVMAAGGDALADHLNGFNPAMKAGHVLVRWFAAEHGSTQCRALTGCDLSTLAGVDRYVEAGTVRRCQDLARAVAARVRASTAA